MAGALLTRFGIRVWAQAVFPDSFAIVEKFPVAYQTIPANALEERLCRRAVKVGSLEGQGTRTVYAWEQAPGCVDLAHEGDNGFMEVHRDTTHPKVVFEKPFCWVQPAKDETGTARFEALVCYYLCVKSNTAFILYWGVGIFEEHFLGACRDVSEQVTREAREKGAADRCVRLS